MHRLILIIIGLAISCGICNHLFKYLFAKAPDLWETPSSEFAEGQWYTCDNNLLYDYYGSDDSGRYYVTSTNDGEYMGFYVYDNQTELADKISNDTFEYLDGNQSELSQEYLDDTEFMAEVIRKYDFMLLGNEDVLERSLNKTKILEMNFSLTSMKM